MSGPVVSIERWSRRTVGAGSFPEPPVAGPGPGGDPGLRFGCRNSEAFGGQPPINMMRFRLAVLHVLRFNGIYLGYTTGTPLSFFGWSTLRLPMNLTGVPAV